MSTLTIPQWDRQGLLPPVDPVDPISPDRSPYQASLLDMVLRFATTPERCVVLRGFLAYRAALHRVGLVDGFQWINGSFTEHVETIEHRAPKDIDVVTFFKAHADFMPTDDQMHLLDPHVAKTRFLVDGYFVELDHESPESLVEHSIYWYGLWSHRRNMVWKGYLQIDLCPGQDRDAQDHLNRLERQRGHHE